MNFLHQLVQGVGTIAIETSNEILYYRSEPAELSNISIASFTDSSQCTSQIDTLKAAYALGGVTTMLGACFTDDISKYTSLTAAWSSENTTVAEDHSIGSVVYPDFTSCMDAKDAAIAGAKVSLPAGKHIWGGICEPHMNAQAESDGFAIDMFSDNF